MKKNNKFRNNSGNSNAYSLNYKFDSISPAGKINGTALDLIKKYNELAKEAHGCGDYIEMEVYRQYAEHYRKIVTEINERRAVRAENMAQQTEENSAAEAESATEAAAPQAEEAPAEATAEDLEKYRLQIETTLNELTWKLDREMGVPYIPQGTVAKKSRKQLQAEQKQAEGK